MNHKLLILAALTMSPWATAAEKHDHEHPPAAASTEEDVHDAKVGPNGGHVVESKAGFAFEVVVDENRMARIRFLDSALKVIPLGEQTIQGIAGERSAPVKLVFAAENANNAHVLVADKALPAGAHVPMVLSIKTTPEAKTIVERFELHLH